MKHLNYFNSHSEYTDPTIKPNVSYCKQEDEVHYNPIPDYSKDYLTFTIISNGTIMWKTSSSKVSSTTISYSINNGQWTNITSSTYGETFDVSAGDKIRFKGNNSAYGIKSSASVYGTTFSGSTASFNIEGNIMSLLYGDDFIDKITFESDCVFPFLFAGTNVVNAHNLILPAVTMSHSAYANMFESCTSLTTAPALPATTLSGYINVSVDGCYYYMFAGCTNLTTAPELPATTLVNSCYFGMFYGCTNLSYIKAMFTTTPGRDYTRMWVSNIASTGTFVKNAAATWDVSGDNGIPTGWTVETTNN